jgi:hypothetical protein
MNQDQERPEGNKGLPSEEAHEQIQQQATQQVELERWAADRVKPWPRKLQSDDYDFRSWAKDASKNCLRAGAVYEYARESRRLRCLLALMNPKRPRTDWEIELLPYCFENLNERDAARALGGLLYCLRDLADYLADNISFGELFRTKRDELEKAFDGLNELLRARRGYRYFSPVVDAAEVAAGSEVQVATVEETLSNDEKRIICGEACSEVIAIRIHWRCTDSEITAALKKFVGAHRPRNALYKPRQRKKGSRRDSPRSALDVLSAMRLASCFPKTVPPSTPGTLAAWQSGASAEFKQSAIELFGPVRLGGHRKDIAESNFDALIVEARELFRREFPFGEDAANAPTLAERVILKSERISSQDKV